MTDFLCYSNSTTCSATGSRASRGFVGPCRPRMPACCSLYFSHDAPGVPVWTNDDLAECEPVSLHFRWKRHQSFLRLFDDSLLQRHTIPAMGADMNPELAHGRVSPPYERPPRHLLDLLCLCYSFFFEMWKCSRFFDWGVSALPFFSAWGDERLLASERGRGVLDPGRFERLLGEAGALMTTRT